MERDHPTNTVHTHRFLVSMVAAQSTGRWAIYCSEYGIINYNVMINRKLYSKGPAQDARDAILLHSNYCYLDDIGIQTIRPYSLSYFSDGPIILKYNGDTQMMVLARCHEAIAMRLS